MFYMQISCQLKNHFLCAHTKNICLNGQKMLIGKNKALKFIKLWNPQTLEVLQLLRFRRFCVFTQKNCYFSMSNRTFKNCHILVNVEISTFLALYGLIFRRFQSRKKWKKIKIFLYTILTLYTIFKNE